MKMFFINYVNETVFALEFAFLHTSLAQRVKASAYKVGDLGLIAGSGRSPGEGNGTPLQYSCLENPMDGGAWVGYSPWDCKESVTTE